MMDPSTDDQIDSHYLRLSNPFLYGHELSAIDLWAAPRSMNTEYTDLVAQHIAANRNTAFDEYTL